MTNINSFIKKWHGRVLEDAGCFVSKEFHSFQVSFFNALRKIARENGWEVINPSYGHYDMSCFIKHGDKYVYVNYSNSLNGGRNVVCLKGRVTGCCAPMLVRTAKCDTDYTGGYNNFCQFEGVEEVIARLFAEQ
jgi:hypothetical protein